MKQVKYIYKHVQIKRTKLNNPCVRIYEHDRGHKYVDEGRKNCNTNKEIHAL